MAAIQNFEWNQGEDLEISVTYRLEGIPVDLTGHQVRMDISRVGASEPVASVHTFNTDDQDAATEDEVIVSSDGTILISVPRSLTLDGGAIFSDILSATEAKYNYDLFVRDTNNKQRKLLMGEIVVKRSITRWI